MPVLQLRVARTQEVLIQKLGLWSGRPGQQDVFRRGHHQNPIVGAVFRERAQRIKPSLCSCSWTQVRRGKEHHQNAIAASMRNHGCCLSLDDPLVVPCTLGS